MEMRDLGGTGLKVSRLGMGLYEIGDAPTPAAEFEVAQLLILLALGFTLAHEQVDTAIVGTRNLKHLCANVAWLENGLPIAPEVVEELHRRFGSVGEQWIQLT
jgi:aryl-alcohol dehydrogenase-like predicted oxidoreductase